MLAIERRQDILELLNEFGSVKVIDLAQRYDVGKETIRRDLKALAEERDISVVYGGAHLYSSSAVQIQEETFISKREQNYEAKREIARRAAEYISPGDVIALNSGSTVECLLDYLQDKTPLSLVTLNVNIAARAATIPGIQVYLPGGQVRNKSGMVIGADSEDFIEKFTISKCFFGVSAISLKRGITHPSMEEVPANRALMAASEQVYLLADSSKFDKHSLYTLASFEELTALFSNDIPSNYEKYLRSLGVELL